MNLTLLGTGTPSPLLHRAGSSYLVSFGDEVILVDCGPGSTRRLMEAGRAPRDITRLFLTHLHYDHCIDYPYLVLNRWDQGVGQIDDLDVYGPPPISQMTEKLFAQDGVFGPDLDARTLHEGGHFVYQTRGGVLPRQRPNPQVTEVSDGETVSGEGWTLDVAEVIHVQPYLTCLAYRLSASGRSIVFGGDTAPIESLTKLAKNADVLIHMCHLLNNVVTDPRITGCCSGHLDAAKTAAEAGVETLVLTHITESLEGSGMRERIVREAGEIFGGTIIFGEDLLDVPFGDVEPSAIR